MTDTKNEDLQILPTANKSVAKKRPRRTYSNEDSHRLSIRLYPDQDESIRKMAVDADRSRNAVVWFIIDWYFRELDAGRLVAPQGKSREDTLIYKQPPFQFRATKEVIERLWDLARKYEYKRINPFIVALVDEYLCAHGKS